MYYFFLTINKDWGADFKNRFLRYYKIFLEIVLFSKTVIFIGHLDRQTYQLTTSFVRVFKK